MTAPGRPRVLVAGVGNVLAGDDGFGVRVAERLLDEGGLPDGARVIETGIGGIHLVQELLGGYEGLVVVDAVRRGDPPGRVCELVPSVPDVQAPAEGGRPDVLAETHYAVPAKALTLAKALGVLPARVRIVGCEPAATELGIGLGPEVERAVGEAAARVRRLVAAWLAAPPEAAARAAEDRPAAGGAG